MAPRKQDIHNSLTSLRERPRLTEVAVRSGVIGLIVIFVSGIGHVLFHPAKNDSSDEARIVSSLVDGGASLDEIPATFVEELGYLPRPIAGTLANPKGGCSTPGGLSPTEFATACRVHDLGYDLLRYAEGRGQRLGPWARFDLDRRLYTDLLATCRVNRCRATATAYYAAVTLNSIRQGYAAPTIEPTLPWATTFFGVIGLAILSGRSTGKLGEGGWIIGPEGAVDLVRRRARPAPNEDEGLHVALASDRNRTTRLANELLPYQLVG